MIKNIKERKNMKIAIYIVTAIAVINFYISALIKYYLFLSGICLLSVILIGIGVFDIYDLKMIKLKVKTYKVEG